MIYEQVLNGIFFLIFACSIGLISFYSIQGYLLVKNWKGERKPIICRMLWGILIFVFMAILFILAGFVMWAQEIGGFSELWKVFGDMFAASNQ